MNNSKVLRFNWEKENILRVIALSTLFIFVVIFGFLFEFAMKHLSVNLLSYEDLFNTPYTLHKGSNFYVFYTVILFGLLIIISTMKSYFLGNKNNKENVLLFIDNIFRFYKLENEVAASLDKNLQSMVIKQLLNTEISQAEQRFILIMKMVQLLPFKMFSYRWMILSDPSAVAVFNHLNSSLVLSREISAKNIFPAFDPLVSSSNNVNPEFIGQWHYNAILETKYILQKYKEIEDIMLILGFDELDDQSKTIVKKLYNYKNSSHKISIWQNILHLKVVFLLTWEIQLVQLRNFKRWIFRFKSRKILIYWFSRWY
ncbi:hypothetical protein ABOD99_03800 [Mycoplasmoides gallisepticum]|uniref:hypothetical protein n=1 Tax=Mycoplasmoides gallisepticum TaxID=2096 RepID=UPI0033060016